MKKKDFKTKKKANARTLNYNTLIKRNNNNTNKDYNTLQLEQINNKLNQNVSPKYKIVKYLGEGINGNLYLAIDSSQNKFIYKKIKLNSPNNSFNNELKMQMNFELGILNFLSNNLATKEYINPCIEHKIINDEVYTLFPVFDGYSLNNLKKYLGKLNHTQYYQILFHLIKVILYGLAKIHQTNIAHQNINTNSILVSTYTNPDNVKVKFTDFGLGCGTNNKNIIEMLNFNNKNKNNNNNDSRDYKKDMFFKFGSCKTYNSVPIKITDKIINKLSESDYLAISQKYDLLCLGMIFSKMLLVFEKLNTDVESGYTNSFRQNIYNIIYKKYINTNKTPDDILPLLNISNNTKKDILEYLKIFWKYVLCKTEERQNCQYILDKIIIYEKYKNDIF